MTDTTTSAPEEETLALPGDGLREGIVDELRRRIGAALVDSELRPNDDLWVRVATGAWADTGRALRDMGFTYFSFLSGLDWLPSPFGRGEDNPDEPAPERTTEVVQGVVGGDTRFQVFARVVDTVRHVGVTIKVDVPDDDLRVESWHTIWAGANWHERETAEMFGIQFVGHPDPRHIYLPGDFEGFPLRKDFPLLSRMIKPWPGIVDVEPMPEEEAEEAAAEVTAGDDAATTGDEAAATDDAAEAVADATTAPEPPTETEVASAPEEAADPAEVTDRTEENAPDQEPAPEAEPVDATPEEPADPTPEDVPPAEAPADPTPEDPPAEPLSSPDEPLPDAEAADGSWSPDIPVADVEGPFGLGSKAARPDGSAPPDHPIKADSATRRFHVPGSDGYDSVVADVWFDSETTARTAGFHSPYDDEASS